METPEIHCPKCNSTQISANKKGFSGTKAVGGALLTGGIGLMAGTIGSNKVVITCLNCGNKFKPGATFNRPKPTGAWNTTAAFLPLTKEENERRRKTSVLVWLVIFWILAIITTLFALVLTMSAFMNNGLTPLITTALVLDIISFLLWWGVISSTKKLKLINQNTKL
jgi:hypothetical protein